MNYSYEENSFYRRNNSQKNPKNHLRYINPSNKENIQSGIKLAT